MLSAPNGPRSTALDWSNDCTSEAVFEGLWDSISAAAPATCGADADVPKKPPEPYVAVRTPSGPAMSGFLSPLVVGPRELNGSTVFRSWRTAPAVKLLAEQAGSRTLVERTLCSLKSCVEENSSNLRLLAKKGRLITMWYVPVCAAL